MPAFNAWLTRLWLSMRGYRSERLTFRYDDSGIRLTRRTPRRRPAPPSDDAHRATLPCAITAELRAEDGRVVFRRVLHDPIPQSAEYVDGNGRLRRAPIARRSGLFFVVVPHTRSTHELVVSAGEAVRLTQPALAGRVRTAGGRLELVRISLR